NQSTEISSEANLPAVPPPSPKIIIDAGGDRVAVAGAVLKFEAKITGLKGEPINAESYIWNMGNGVIKRGPFVYYSYDHVGDYNVDLTVSVGGVSMLDRAAIMVVPNSLTISEVKPGFGGWIEIFNNSKFTVDVSRWRISNGSEVFYFPENTKILPQSRIVITHEASGIIFKSYGSTILLYPDGKEAGRLDYSGYAQNDESFHLIRGEARLGLESPGEERFTARIAKSPLNTVSEVKDTIQAEDKEVVQEDVAAANLAAVNASLSDGGWFGRPVLWFGFALFLGLLSAAGFLFVKRKGFF
ncbi:MAG: lamin tail domain-containing protein, partial [Patescibacteria group bacterium]